MFSDWVLTHSIYTWLILYFAIIEQPCEPDAMTTLTLFGFGYWIPLFGLGGGGGSILTPPLLSAKMLRLGWNFPNLCKTKIHQKAKIFVKIKTSILWPLDLKTPISATRRFRPIYARYGNLNNFPSFYARDLIFFKQKRMIRSIWKINLQVSICSISKAR